MNKIKKIFNLIAFTFILVATSMTNSYAGVSSSSGTGAGGGGGGKWPLTDFAWKIVQDVPKGTKMVSYYGTEFVLPNTGNMAYVVPTNPPTKRSFPNDWTTWKEHPSMAKNNHAGVRHYQNWDLNRNSVGVQQALLNSPTYKDFQDELFKNSFKDVGYATGMPNVPKQGFAYTADGKYADLIYLEGSISKPVDKVDYNSVVVRLENSGNPSDNFDITHLSNEELYNRTGNSVNFSYMSKENEYNFNHTIKAKIYTIRKRLAGEIVYDKNGNILADNTYTTYDITNIRNVSNTASWSANIPNLTHNYYLPMNLDTEKYMSPSELSSYGFNYQDIKNIGIKGTTENNKQVNDGTPITLVDNNSSKNFDVVLNNDQHGIPTKAEGGVDILKNKPAKPGLGDSMLWNQIYYSPVLEISSNNKNYMPHVTSIIMDGKENLGNEIVTKGYGYRGGTFKYRSIRAGSYNLGSNGRPFWMTKYGTSIFFDYGASYNGQVTSAGIFGPLNSNGTINVNENRRFVGEINGQIEQPIVYGSFDVKTVGGYKK